MLSQRIAGLVVEVRRDPSTEAAALLNQGIDEMARAHTTLTEGQPASGIAPLPADGPLWDAYFGPEGTDPLLQEFLEAAQAAAHDDAAAATVRRLARGALLDRLQHAVATHEADAQRRIEQLRLVETALWLTTLLLLLLEAVFIFRPLLQRLASRVDELAAANERLVQREARLRLLLESAGDAIIPIDLDGRIMEGASVQAGEWFHDLRIGGEAAALLAAGDGEIEQVFAATFERLRDPSQDFDPAVRTVPVQLRRGDEFFRVGLREMQQAGRRVGVLAVIRQVTALIERERLREQHSQLERSLHAASRANKAKSRFLATMSHELRTPLNAIIGYSELVREDLDREEQVEDLGHVLHAARHLLAMIDQILDLSKVEAGQLQVHVEPTDLAGILSAIDPVGATLCAHNDNRWSFEPGDPMRVLTDPLRLEQILLNLISNSTKFTTGGRVVLRAVLLGDTVSIQVSDTGIGMTPEEQERVWAEYQQADASTSRTYGGTGLGLTLARRLADLIGASLQMESAAGQGTTMTVTVPALDRPGDTP